ncbi:CRISPR-associated protein Cas4 [Candidatus Acidianus copahuensis]|uniref:CRISPR-associated protein Cas4 n=1 Tax=Candidatus Acidianus copahuensis TaxID=1160895 RepID=UPI000693B2FC|nr:CRISPR-associated protein Cas4 [Candidatus Acidianus copahuensis]
MEEGYITGIDVKHFTYCPLITYYERVMHFRERVTEAMKKGEEVDKDVALQFVYPTLKPKEVERKPFLFSRKWRISGVPDFLLIFPGYVVPLDVKDTDKVNRDHKLQVFFYCLILEENGKVPKAGFLYYTSLKKLVMYAYTADERKEVIEFLARIKNIIQGKRPKVRQPVSKCENCGFRHVCKPTIRGKLAYA